LTGLNEDLPLHKYFSTAAAMEADSSRKLAAPVELPIAYRQKSGNFDKFIVSIP
jgi:hypothetical protein